MQNINKHNVRSIQNTEKQRVFGRLKTKLGDFEGLLKIPQSQPF